MKFALFCVALFAILTWAPWLDDNKIRDEVQQVDAKVHAAALREDNKKDCPYTIEVFPLGRLTHSCLGSHFVTFWGWAL